MASLYFKVVEWLNDSNPNNQLLRPVRVTVNRPVFRFENTMSPLNRISMALLSAVGLLIGLLCLAIALMVGYFVFF